MTDIIRLCSILETACINYNLELLNEAGEDATDSTENSSNDSNSIESKVKAKTESFIRIVKQVSSQIISAIKALINKMISFINNLINKNKSDTYTCIKSFKCNKNILNCKAITDVAKILIKIEKANVSLEDIELLKSYSENNNDIEISEGTILNAKSLFNAYEKVQKKLDMMNKEVKTNEEINIDQSQVDLINEAKSLIPAVINDTQKITSLIANTQYFAPTKNISQTTNTENQEEANK